jgi:hypothetical protein
MGVIEESMEAYHAHPAISSSELKTALHRGPRAFKILHRDRLHTPKQTASMKTGSNFEDALCGRAELAFVPEGMKLNTKAGVAFKEEHEGKIIVPYADRFLFTDGIDNIRMHHVAGPLIENAIEQPVFRRPYPGLPGIQSRPDWWQPNTLCAPDLKTTQSLKGFKYSVEDYLYHVQAAFVRAASGFEETIHPLIVLEKKIPHPCRVVWLREDYVRAGTEIMKRGLDRLARCFEEDTWPLLEQDVITLAPPEKTLAALEMGGLDEDASFDDGAFGSGGGAVSAPAPF